MKENPVKTTVLPSMTLHVRVQKLYPENYKIVFKKLKRNYINGKNIHYKKPVPVNSVIIQIPQVS